MGFVVVLKKVCVDWLVSKEVGTASSCCESVGNSELGLINT